MLRVVGDIDVVDTLCSREWRRLKPAERIPSPHDDPVRITHFGRQVKQNHRYFGISQMRGNLRTHHTGPEHRRLANYKSAQDSPSLRVRAYQWYWRVPLLFPCNST